MRRKLIGKLIKNFDIFLKITNTRLNLKFIEIKDWQNNIKL